MILKISMLSECNLIAFVATENAEQARTFYRDILGLPLVSDDGFASVFDAHGTMLRVVRVQQRSPVPYTVLGWEVSDIELLVSRMHEGGVQFEHYPGIDQDEVGVWTAPGGAKVAWFKDPDGNLLSVSQHPPV